MMNRFAKQRETKTTKNFENISFKNNVAYFYLIEQSSLHWVHFKPFKDDNEEMQDHTNREQ